jgi:hypothetical protein
MKKVALVLLALFAFATLASAQAVVTNPTTVSFTASADHAAMALDGTTPLVTRYDLQVYLEATPTGTPLVVLDLGKPTPVNSTITVTNAIWFAALTPKTRYVAKAAAVGPTGTGVSGVSNPFGNVGPAGAPGTPTVSKQ